MKILVVDDHTPVSAGLRAYLKEIEPEVPEKAPLQITTIRTLAESIPLINADDPPDLVFLDLHLSDSSGTQTLERFQRANKHKVAVVVYTGLSSNSPRTVDILLKCYNELGAQTVILKSENEATTLRGLPCVLLGERWLTTDVQDLLIRGYQHPAVRLTESEKKVAECLAQGLFNQQIADKLGYSDDYTRGLVSRVIRKFGVQTRLQAVLAMQKAGIYPQDDVDTVQSHEPVISLKT